MKILILIIVAFCLINNFASANPLKPELLTKVDDDLREIIEGIKLEMPNGFPQYGIPPLAPFRRNFTQVDIQKETFIFKGEFKNLIVNGLNDFDVAALHLGTINQKLNFDFNFNHIHIVGDYNANVWLKFLGFMQHLYGNGVWNMSFIDLRLKGSFRLIPGLNGLKIGSFVCEVSLGNVISDITGIMDNQVYTKIINRWIEEFLIIAINDNAEVISENIKNAVVPIVNQMLGKYTLAEIIAFIIGGH